MLAAMRAATAHCLSIGDLLETLVARDFLPAEALDDPRRAFLHPSSQNARVPTKELEARIDALRAEGNLPYFVNSTKKTCTLSWARCVKQPLSIEHALAFASSFQDMASAEYAAAEALHPDHRRAALRPFYFVWKFIDASEVKHWRDKPLDVGQDQLNGPAHPKLGNRDLPRYEEVMELGFIADRLYGTDTFVMLAPTLGAGDAEFPP